MLSFGMSQVHCRLGTFKIIREEEEKINKNDFFFRFFNFFSIKMHVCDIIFCPMDQRNDNRITEGSIWTFLPIEKNK